MINRPQIPPTNITSRMNRDIVSMEPSGIRRVAEAARSIEGCISLTLGEPAAGTPRPLREATRQALAEGHTHYPPNIGLEALRESIAAYESEHYGGPLTAANVLVTCGSTEALACALLGVVEPGDEVIVPMPAFGLYAQQLQIARGKLTPLSTAEHGFQIDAEALLQCVTPHTKAIVLNSPNNPTGVQYTQASIDAVVDTCLQHDLFLIYDAVYDRLSYQPPVPSPPSEALGGRLIHCSAFSKTFSMTGWRMGYLLAAEPVLRQLLKVHAALTVGVSTFSQVGCVDFQAVDTSAMLAEYRANRDLVVERLGGMGLEVVRPDGAFYAFPSITRLGMTDEAFVDRLMQSHRVALVPGSCFGAPGFVRLSYCCGREVLTEGLRRLEAFIKTL